MYQLQLMVAIPQHLGTSPKKQPQVTPNEVSYSAVITACDPWDVSVVDLVGYPFGDTLGP